MVTGFPTALFMCAAILGTIGVLSQETVTDKPTTYSGPANESGQVEAGSERSNVRATGMDAKVETTPADCSGGIRCGFQVYDPDTRLPSQPFIKYCNCLEGTECVVDGENMVQKFFYYKCKNTTQPEVTTTAEESTAEELAREPSSGGRQQRAQTVEDPASTPIRMADGIAIPVDPEKNGASSEVELLRSRVGQIVGHSEL